MPAWAGGSGLHTSNPTTLPFPLGPTSLGVCLPTCHPPASPGGCPPCYKMPPGRPLLQAAFATDSPRASQLPWLWSLSVRGSVSWHAVSWGLHSPFLSRQRVPQGLPPCVLIYQMLVKSQLYVHCARCWQKTACETELCPHEVHSRGGLQGRQPLTNITRTCTFAL